MTCTVQFNRQVKFRTQTSGKGYWSMVSKVVTVNRIELAWADEDMLFGELRVYFETADWDVDQDGLIYTDPKWSSSFKQCLKTLGFSNKALGDLNYSEQGMQGLDYVSMDVGQYFMQECCDLYRFAINKKATNF